MSESLVAGPADHMAISVADFEGMTEWYKTTFGLKEDVADRLNIPEAGIKGSLLMGPNGFRLELTTPTVPKATMDDHAQHARADLDAWTKQKAQLLADGKAQRHG